MYVDLADSITALAVTGVVVFDAEAPYHRQLRERVANSLPEGPPLGTDSWWNEAANNLRRILEDVDEEELSENGGSYWLFRTQVLASMGAGRTDEEDEEFAERMGILSGVSQYNAQEGTPTIGNLEQISGTIQVIRLATMLNQNIGRRPDAQPLIAGTSISA